MARHGKSSKSSHSEPLDSLLDLAAAATLDFIAATRREKQEIVAGKSILMQSPVLQLGLAS